MKGYLIQLAIGFLMRRLLPADLLERVRSLVDGVEQRTKDDKEKFAIVKDALTKAAKDRVGENNVNTAIELAVMAKRLRSNK